MLHCTRPRSGCACPDSSSMKVKWLVAARLPAQSNRGRNSSSLCALSFWRTVMVVPMAGPIAAEAVTFAGYGGTYQRDIVKALMQPSADLEGARLALASHNGMPT